jgi:hypothetical protein
MPILDPHAKKLQFQGFMYFLPQKIRGKMDDCEVNKNVFFSLN